ncbi:hypothetical protein [Streptomyces sp. NPDC052225]|uniref:DUF6907 domain-containing protein n=1 Tax=Streptomyces sp. NPDC052225 TaxID=3154949 RepID=UPI00343B50C7
MSGDLTPYQPTLVTGADEPGVRAVVHCALALSREQLMAALSVGYSERNDGRPLAELSEVEIQGEVEGYLGAQAYLDLDQQTRTDIAGAYRPQMQGLTAELGQAVDRAFPAPRSRPVEQVQRPRYGDGMVTLQTLDVGEVTIPEPGWCRGHGAQLVGYQRDIAHASERTRSGLLEVFISWAPFIEPALVVSLVLDPDDTDGDYQPEEIATVVADLRTAADQLERVAADAIRLRGAS